jgi:hypothetical protein
MIEEFRSLLADIDPQLPAYFLVKGAKAVPVPRTKAEFDKLVANGYEPLAEGVVYEELSQDVISALHETIRWMGGRILVFFAYPAVSLLSHESKREGSALQKALSSKKEPPSPPKPKEEDADGAQTAKRRNRR